jgi:hypothetical protein
MRMKQESSGAKVWERVPGHVLGCLQHHNDPASAPYAAEADVLIAVIMHVYIKSESPSSIQR